MTIQLDLESDVAERLAAEAKARGIRVEEYAESLLREAMDSRPEPDGKLSIAQLSSMLQAIAEGAEALPKMPTGAFTREHFYEERF